MITALVDTIIKVLFEALEITWIQARRRQPAHLEDGSGNVVIRFDRSAVCFRPVHRLI